MLFDDAWFKAFMVEWNKSPELADALAKIKFNSVIGYGTQDSKECLGFIAVVDGIVTEAGLYDGRDLRWDMRAKVEDWQKWISKPQDDPIGMVGIGLAFTINDLKFKKGDFKAMIADPKMAGPFIKSFACMGRVPVE